MSLCIRLRALKRNTQLSVECEVAAEIERERRSEPGSPLELRKTFGSLREDKVRSGLGRPQGTRLGRYTHSGKDLEENGAVAELDDAVDVSRKLERVEPGEEGGGLSRRRREGHG
jgi:hypothetical protein